MSQLEPNVEKASRVFLEETGCPFCDKKIIALMSVSSGHRFPVIHDLTKAEEKLIRELRVENVRKVFFSLPEKDLLISKAHESGGRITQEEFERFQRAIYGQLNIQHGYNRTHVPKVVSQLITELFKKWRIAVQPPSSSSCPPLHDPESSKSGLSKLSEVERQIKTT